MKAANFDFCPSGVHRGVLRSRHRPLYAFVPPPLFPQVPIQFWQQAVADMRLRTEVKAGCVLDYACDEPTLPPHLTLTAKGAGSSEVTADMNFFREYNKLYYENFIYIAATHTFSG